VLDDGADGEEAAPDMVPVDDILFSLPTICDALPAVADPADNGVLEIFEDDWRQVEVVAASLSDVIEAELAAIRVVYDRHARRAASGFTTGFDAIHVRAQPASPLPGPVSLTRVLDMLPQPSRRYAGVAFTGTTGVAAGSLAMDFGPVSLYGLADGDAITVLGLDSSSAADLPPGLIRGLREVLEAFDLVIVDWCGCSVTGPDAITDAMS
jgi:hypothetical protein